MASDPPCIVDDLAAVLDDGSEVLLTDAADAGDVGEAGLDDKRVEALVGEGVADAPGERADSAAFQTNSFVEDECHYARPGSQGSGARQSMLVATSTTTVSSAA